MLNKKNSLLWLSVLLVSSAASHAEISSKSKHPIYFGALGGYGSTTWEGLVASADNKNPAITLSTPIGVTEGGNVWGLLAGFEFTPYFALEANYIHYPKALVAFDRQDSLFSFTHDGLGEFSTKTEMYSLMAKVMLIIPDTNYRVYSSAGVANIHRRDMLLDEWLLSPTVGLGINYVFNDRWMLELGGNYTTGFGESQINPADSFIPFLYSGSLRLAYHFG